MDRRGARLGGAAGRTRSYPGGAQEVLLLGTHLPPTASLPSTPRPGPAVPLPAAGGGAPGAAAPAQAQAAGRRARRGSTAPRARRVAARPTGLGASQNSGGREACFLKFVYFKT